jgi:hypothetical protein
MIDMPAQALWPELPLTAWQNTKDTLHLYTQVVGKIRLALAPWEPEFAQVTLYVTARGLTTSPMQCGDRTFQVDFDFIDHAVVIWVSDGATKRIALLPPRSVADFYSAVVAALAELKLSVQINPVPQEVPDLTPCDQDTKHCAYDPDSVQRFWSILRMSDMLLKQHRAPFRGRHTPVHFFWGGLDLAYTRYSGRPAEPPPGANYLYRLSMDAEEIYAGFWPGDARFPEPAFASYVYPKPAGIGKAAIAPAAASWNEQLGLFILRYEDVRTSTSPHEVVQQFLSSTYEASATLAGWDRALLA